MFQINQRVFFGRPNGEQTLGEVVKINPRHIKVRQIETRGNHTVGKIWTVSPSLLRPADASVNPMPVARPVSSSAVNAELEALGLPGNLQGRSLNIGRQTFIVVDCKLANPKYPVIAANANGTRYKFTVGQIRTALSA